MYKLETVFRKVKVEDERTPEFYRDRLFILKGEVRDVGDYFGDGVFYSQVETKTTQEVTHWLKPQEAFVFTSEQLNEYTATVIRQALETAAENAEVDFEGYDKEFVNKQSIIDTFEETFNLLKL